MGNFERALLAGLGLIALSASAIAADYTAEYDKKVKASQNVGALGNDLAGDSFNFYTGSVEFSAIDVSLPGNSGLSVAIGRRYRVEPEHQRSDLTASQSDVVARLFGDWDLDVPHISTTMIASSGWAINSTTPLNRCSVVGQVTSTGAAATGAPERLDLFSPRQFWHGYSLQTSSGSQPLLLASLPNNERPSTGGPYHWTTNQGWWLSCLGATANNAGGEAFLAIAPDGTKYRFDWLTRRAVNSVFREIPDLTGPNSIKYAFREDYLMLPTRIEDRFGNWVQYQWSNDSFAKLLSVASGPVGTQTPDRTIALGYNQQGFVSSINDGVRTWSYQYTSSGSLSQVTLPDGSSWQLGLTGLNNIEAVTLDCTEPTVCFGGGTPASTMGSGFIVHPSGARVDFYFDNHFQYSPSSPILATYPLALTQKTISGPGIPSSTWKYSFSPSQSQAQIACDAGACPTQVVTDQVDPDSRITRRVFGAVVNQDESLLLGEMLGNVVTTTTSAGTPVKTCSPRFGCDIENGSSPITSSVPVFYSETDYTYVPAGQSTPYVVRVGVDPLAGASVSSIHASASFAGERRLPVQTRSHIQQAVTLSTTTNSFDVYAHPTSVTRSSTGSAGGNFSRTETTTYHHDTTKWVIGQVASVTDVGTGKVVSQTDYDPATVLPWRTYRFGVLQSTMSYNADGTLATVKDGRNNTISLSDWSRGIPRRIDYPTNVFESATVNAQGWITSTTDELGVSTSYGYDAMGRLSGITYPTGDTTAWNPLSRGFVAVAASEYGIGAGHWKQTVQTGNGKATTYYDAQWRPVLVVTEDTGNASSQSFVVTRYDSSGRAVFQSYPVASLTTVNDTLTGVRTLYDALGRVYQTQQDAEAPLTQLVTTTEYLSGFITRVTNPRGIVSETKYQLFDSPSTESPVEIITAKGLAEQQTTTIVRDGFGKPLSVTRAGVAP